MANIKTIAKHLPENKPNFGGVCGSKPWTNKNDEWVERATEIPKLKKQLRKMQN